MKRELILDDSLPPRPRMSRQMIALGVVLWAFALLGSVSLFAVAWQGLAQQAKDEEAWCQSHGYGHGFISKWGNGCNLPDHEQFFRWQLEQMEKQK